MEKMKNNKWRRIPILMMLTFALLISAIMIVGIPVSASAAEDNTYIAADGTSQAIPADATTVSSSDTAWNAGWYVVDRNVEITSIQFELTGDVHLVLKDGCTLTITGNLYVGSGSLYIYGQSGGTGTLTVQDTGNGSYNTVALYVYDDLIIYGGTVNANATATASTGTAVGISATNIFVNGGTVNVTATGASNKAYGISGDTTISGGTVTLNATGKDAANTRLFDRTMAVNDEGTIVLPTTMWRDDVMALGITGTGGIKYGNAHIDTDGNCITHYWFETIYKKDTTNHYTRRCSICGNGDEETIEPCVYDNVCDTDCNICKIVRTVPHQYGEDGFCTVCRYSDTPAVDSDGDGFLEIDTAQKLWWFTHQVNGGNNSLNVELTANIDLSGTCGADIGNWMPIGNNYSGHFNGQGYTISNLYMSGDDQYIGLFGYVKGATIENVTVTGSVSSTFSFIYYPDTYESFEGAAGGVVAYLDGGTIRNCHVDMTISGGSIIGGICGKLDSDGLIENCTTLGSAAQGGENVNYIGGIVGELWSGTVRGCTNAATVGNILKTASYAGGIAGASSGIIENCLNFGNVEIAGTYGGHGGITGNQGWDNIVRNCGNHGTVSGYCTGGIVGDNCGIIENCYNVGSVSGTSEYVTPIAYSRDGGTATNNYYLSDTTTEDGGRTAEQFASGQVAYELNGSTTTDESIWKQTLGTDSYPALTGEPVYCVTSQKCDGTPGGSVYSNSTEDVIVHEDTDNDSFCDLCKWLIITEIAFPDANFRTYIAEEFDTDKDGLLSLDEIAAVVWIDARNKGISDLSGVAYFTNLSELCVFNNSLTTLDVSQNKALIVLNCGQNLLTALDVSQNTELSALFCELNLLTSLDVSANEKLETLYCSDNPNLTSLKVNTAIVEIDVANTALRSLDLSECSQLEYLNYDGTNVTSLELPTHFLLDGSIAYPSEISIDIDQKTMVLDLRDFVSDVSRVTIMNNSATIVGNYLYISMGATQVNYTYDTGAAEGSLPHAVIININNPHTHSFDGNAYCAGCGLQATIRVDAFEEKCFFTSSFADALALASAGTADAPRMPAFITHFADVTVDEAVTMTGGYVTLQLNGHKLTFAATNDTPFTLIAGTLTIRDDSAAKTGTMYHGVTGNEERTVIALKDYARLTLMSGTLDFSRVEAAIAVENGTIMQDGGKITAPILLNNGRYELDGGTIETTYRYAFIIDSDGSAVYHIEITGGTVSVNDTLGTGGLLHFPRHGCTETVTITGGTFKNVANKPFRICVYNDYANVTVTGGTFEQGLVYENMHVIDQDLDVSDFLAHGYAFYDSNADLILLTEGQTEITGFTVIGLCSHTDNDQDHLCDVCGDILTLCEDQDSDHNCDICGKILSECTGGTATCVDKAICTVCGQPWGERDPENHSGTSHQLVPNDNGTHNVVHSCCQAVITENAACTPADCTKVSLCDCGYRMKATHTEHDFSGAYVYDDTYHWKKCQNCDVTGEQDYHTGQNSGDCTKPILCACGHVVKEAQGHSSLTWMFSTDEYHYEGCSTCTQPVNDVRTPHDFSVWEHDKYGHRLKCSGCDYTEESRAHTDADEDRLCDECGADLSLFEKIQIALGEDITVYYSIIDRNLTDPQMRFTINGYTQTVDGVLEGEQFKFVFDGVAPQWIGDTIKAELIDGGTVIETKDYSVLAYLNELKSQSAEELGYTTEKYNALITLIDDLLVYGGAAQTYTGHKTDALVSEGITGSAFEEITSTDKGGSPIGEAVTFNGMNVYFDNTHRLMFRFSAADLNGVTFTVRVNDGEETAIEYTASGEFFIIMTDGIKAIGFDDVYTITAYKDGVADAMLTYSVRSYVYSKQDGTDPIAALAKATYNYGISAKAYKNAQ